MSRKHSTEQYGRIDSIVNALSVLVIVSLIGVGYLSALGTFAGVA